MKLTILLLVVLAALMDGCTSHVVPPQKAAAPLTEELIPVDPVKQGKPSRVVVLSGAQANQLELYSDQFQIGEKESKSIPELLKFLGEQLNNDNISYDLDPSKVSKIYCLHCMETSIAEDGSLEVRYRLRGIFFSAVSEIKASKKKERLTYIVYQPDESSEEMQVTKLMNVDVPVDRLLTREEREDAAKEVANPPDTTLSKYPDGAYWFCDCAFAYTRQHFENDGKHSLILDAGMGMDMGEAPKDGSVFVPHNVLISSTYLFDDDENVVYVPAKR